MLLTFSPSVGFLLIFVFMKQMRIQNRFQLFKCSSSIQFRNKWQAIIAQLVSHSVLFNQTIHANCKPHRQSVPGFQSVKNSRIQ